MNKVLLMILDGWGKTKNPSVSAITNANTPFIDELHQKYSCSELLTHGKHVGLPDNQMGNSEVGHMNLGAGRIVYQDLAKINNAIKKRRRSFSSLKTTKFLKDSKESVLYIYKNRGPFDSHCFSKGNSEKLTFCEATK